MNKQNMLNCINALYEEIRRFKTMYSSITPKDKLDGLSLIYKTEADSYETTFNALIAHYKIEYGEELVYEPFE